jgi:hypothetical protein
VVLLRPDPSSSSYSHRIQDDLGIPAPLKLAYSFKEGQYKGHAYANFWEPEHAQACRNALHGFVLDGCRLNVEGYWRKPGDIRGQQLESFAMQKLRRDQAKQSALLPRYVAQGDATTSLRHGDESSDAERASSSRGRSSTVNEAGLVTETATLSSTQSTHFSRGVSVNDVLWLYSTSMTASGPIIEDARAVLQHELSGNSPFQDHDVSCAAQFGQFCCAVVLHSLSSPLAC